METGFLFIFASFCYGDPVLGDLLFDAAVPEGAFITIPGLEDALLASNPATKTRGTESGIQQWGSAPLDLFRREGDYLYFEDLPSSVELRDPDEEGAIANSRKLLLGDEKKGDQALQEFSEEVEDDAWLQWRLKDHSLLQRLQGLEWQAKEEAPVEPPGGKRQPLLQKRRSDEGALCRPPSECEWGAMRRKLLLGLAAAHSSPLSDLMDYRLKRRPSIYVSKKPDARHDIGTPDIYEMEVDVTPLSSSTSRTEKRPRAPTVVSAPHHKKFLPNPSSPKFVSLGSLYNRDEPEPNHKASRSGAPMILPRGEGGIQLNPQAGGIRRHLPFRRPVAFKYTRGTGDRAPVNATKELSPLERITLNKTPGIVLEHPNIVTQGRFGGFSPLPSDAPRGNHGFMRLRPGLRRQKKRKKTPARPQDQKDSYQVPKQLKGHRQPLSPHGKQGEIPSRRQVSPQKKSVTSTETSTALPTKAPRTPYGPPHNLLESQIRRAKGQVPTWLMTLQKERVTQAPPTAYFPEASTVKWIPIESGLNITPELGPRKNKSPPPRGSHRTNLGEQVRPRGEQEIDEYLPPDGAHPVKAIRTPTIPRPYQATTYSPPIYIPPYSKSPSNPKSNSSGPTYRPPQPHVIYINDDDYSSSPDDFNDDNYDDLGDYEYYYDDDSYDEDEYDDEYYDDDYDVLELVTGGRVPFMPHIIMADLDDILHDLDILEYGYILGIPGIAGRDYPILQFIPLTTFRCHLVADYPGYYADMEAGCQVFHVCHRSGRQDSFLCPNGTIFNQKYFVCDWWYNFACEDAAFFYPVNAAIEYQEVALHEGHLLGGYSFPGTSTGKSRQRETTDGERTRRRSSLRGRKSKRRRTKRKPHHREPSSRVLGFRG